MDYLRYHCVQNIFSICFEIKHLICYILQRYMYSKNCLPPFIRKKKRKYTKTFFNIDTEDNLKVEYGL